MHSTKRISKALPLKRLIRTQTPKITTRKMSFFPLTAYPTSTSSFSPLFRLLDDFEQHQSGNSPSHYSRHGGAFRSFTPKFDVKEIADAYELHGELPGIEQQDVEIEFTDAQTLLIKGRTEKSYTRGTPPAGFIEDSEKPAQIESGEQQHHVTPHKASVEDAPDAENGTDTTVANTKSSSSEVEKKKEEKKEPAAKYWVSERSIGEFSRSFTFPGRIDQEGVTASMKNGILSIVVPKSKKPEGRKIAIQ